MFSIALCFVCFVTQICMLCKSDQPRVALFTILSARYSVSNTSIQPLHFCKRGICNILYLAYPKIDDPVIQSCIQAIYAIVWSYYYFLPPLLPFSFLVNLFSLCHKINASCSLFNNDNAIWKILIVLLITIKDMAIGTGLLERMESFCNFHLYWYISSLNSSVITIIYYRQNIQGVET